MKEIIKTSLICRGDTIKVISKDWKQSKGIVYKKGILLTFTESERKDFGVTLMNSKGDKSPKHRLLVNNIGKLGIILEGKVYTTKSLLVEKKLFFYPWPIVKSS